MDIHMAVYLLSGFELNDNNMDQITGIMQTFRTLSSLVVVWYW